MTHKREKLRIGDRHRIDGETISGKIIEIGAGKMMDIIYGGTVLDDCEIRVLGSGSSVNIYNATIRNSIFKTRRKLCNVQFVDVGFVGSAAD